MTNNPLDPCCGKRHYGLCPDHGMPQEIHDNYIRLAREHAELTKELASEKEQRLRAEAYVKEKLLQIADYRFAHDREMDKLMNELKEAQEAEAQAQKLAEALEKMLLAACWYHEGPYGETPNMEDYKKAKVVYQNYKEGR